MQGKRESGLCSEGACAHPRLSKAALVSEMPYQSPESTSSELTDDDSGRKGECRGPTSVRRRVWLDFVARQRGRLLRKADSAQGFGGERVLLLSLER
jgi:hypothetical protein